jgi:DNA-binding MarR family transcriptional regulator
MIIAELEQTTALRIILHLYKEEKASRTDLRKNIDASIAAIYNALPKLRNLGLIEETKEEAFPFTVVVTLTKKGKKVASHLSEIEKILAK